MYTTTVATVVLGAFAALTSAQIQAHPAPALRAIEARGTSECASVATKILPGVLSDMPTPSPGLASYVEASVTITNPCVDPTVTGSFAAAWTSYASSYTSWSSKHLDDLRSLWKACSDVPEVADSLPTGTDVCSSNINALTSQSHNAGPRETGMPIAAGAIAAGIIAAVL